ncbi:Tetratricopeptide repeat protein 14 [Gaertneriomyces sp. JEL0708]|nr:Tetratricopeptide repeat protein 14 [Gaertneriomyces sp. JEL0708]
MEPPKFVDGELEPILQAYVEASALSTAFQNTISRIEARPLDGHDWTSPIDASNPAAYTEFISRFGIEDNWSHLVDVSDLCGSSLNSGQAPFQRNMDYKQLRDQQQAEYAHQMVAEGILSYQRGEFTEAAKKYQIALQQDPECAEAYVARGALHAHYQKAIRDFERAIALDPSHRNAARYLKMTEDKLAEIEAEKESAVRGEFLMPMSYDHRKSQRSRVDTLSSTMATNSTSGDSGESPVELFHQHDEISSMLETTSRRESMNDSEKIQSRRNSGGIKHGSVSPGRRRDKRAKHHRRQSQPEDRYCRSRSPRSGASRSPGSRRINRWNK